MDHDSLVESIINELTSSRSRNLELEKQLKEEKLKYKDLVDRLSVLLSKNEPAALQPKNEPVVSQPKEEATSILEVVHKLPVSHVLNSYVKTNCRKIIEEGNLIYFSHKHHEVLIYPRDLNCIVRSERKGIRDQPDRVIDLQDLTAEVSKYINIGYDNHVLPGPISFQKEERKTVLEMITLTGITICPFFTDDVIKDGYKHVKAGKLLCLSGFNQIDLIHYKPDHWTLYHNKGKLCFDLKELPDQISKYLKAGISCCVTNATPEQTKLLIERLSAL